MRIAAGLSEAARLAVLGTRGRHFPVRRADGGKRDPDREYGRHFVNSGSGVIVGNVDLADWDDRFEARDASELQGQLRMGNGNDTLLLAGGAISGTALGGEGQDTLLINLDQDRSIDGDNLSSFEVIRRDGAGTGILTARGSFDIDTLNLDGITLRVASGTHLSTQGDVTLTGSDNAERLIVEGSIDGAVSLGGGADRVELNAARSARSRSAKATTMSTSPTAGRSSARSSAGLGIDTIAFR